MVLWAALLLHMLLPPAGGANEREQVASAEPLVEPQAYACSETARWKNVISAELRRQEKRH